MKTKISCKNLLAILLLEGYCLSAQAYTNYVTVDGIRYYGNGSDGNCAVVNNIYSNGNTNYYKGDIVIPSIITARISNTNYTWTVAEIWTSAFADCTQLTSVSIPNTVTKIRPDAFNNCTSLTTITIPNNVTLIDDNAFNGCTNLTSVNIPNSVTEVGPGAFEGCTNLPVEGFLRYADSYLVEVVDKTQTTYTIREGTRLMAKEMFSGCTNLTTVSIPNSLEELGIKTFYNCTGLTTVVIPTSITKIPQSCFEGCTGLTSVTIHNSVTSIGSSSFKNCTSLTSVIIPGSVTTIGGQAFYNCTGLKELVLENPTPYDIRSNQFYGDNYNQIYKKLTIYVPSDAVSAYQKATYWKNALAIIPISVSLDQSTLELPTGNTQSLDATVVPTFYASRLTWESSDTNVATVSSDGTVTAVSAGTATITASLPSGATATCVVTVTGPFEVDGIRYEFNDDGTSVKVVGNGYSGNLVIPSEVTYNSQTYSVTAIDDDAFGGCLALYSIDVPNSVSSLHKRIISRNSNPNCIMFIPDGVTFYGNVPGVSPNIVQNGICNYLCLDNSATSLPPHIIPSFVVPRAFIATNATYTRSTTSKFGTICLPYAVNSDSNVKFYSLDRIEGSTLYLTEQAQVGAGVPAIFEKLTDNGSLNFNGSNVAVLPNPATPGSGDLKLIGTYEKLVITDPTELAKSYYISKDQFHQATNSLTVNPFRAYFTYTGSSSSKSFDIAVDNDITAIRAFDGDSASKIIGIYDINGVKYNTLQKGLNIVKLANGETQKVQVK